MGIGKPLLILGHWAHINLHAKWHLDPFSRFATIHRDRYTDRHTDARIIAIADLIGFAYSGQLKMRGSHKLTDATVHAQHLPGVACTYLQQ